MSLEFAFWGSWSAIKKEADSTHLPYQLLFFSAKTLAHFLHGSAVKPLLPISGLWMFVDLWVGWGDSTII